MKTLEEFIQRLQDDAAFEKQAYAFDHSDDLMAFAKREGYDFTLEQLMGEFEPGDKSAAETGDLAPAPVSASPPPIPEEGEFPRQSEALSSPERGVGLLKREHSNFTREPTAEKSQQPTEARPRLEPLEPEEEPRAGLFKAGGGRHRGFSPQRLKSTSEEEP